ncbi:hypothetical protein M409DRAFT_58113 [Zasmidium cellare ATCC 36951]|uniref:Uncharacterized protein n=1 Tax=Zasmidium cellare ATCC 36951 TaxID=1080233 RepID=A0A6A6C6P4_ZASCE|nr:uncharacterized protein M409DRAFT_58113 [Zasmidium cellare ATCC 36951]KAF2162705.1 hypothetical protein M409DRAFT_58113 [Zasmidium cellare ATCC 36951]
MADEPESRLLGLAPELRNRIYDMVFEDNEVDWNSATSPPPGLLLACKQTHTEAIGACYELSTFTCKDSCFARDRLSCLPVKYSNIIKNVCLGAADETCSGEIFLLEEKAFKAQLSLLRLQSLAKIKEDKGLKTPGAIGAVVRVKTSLAGDEKVKTDEPWCLFAGKTFQLSAELVDQDFRDEYVNMLRFFKYDHHMPSRCWTWLWGGERWNCRCPMKPQ